MLNPADRYIRQTLFHGVGLGGQQKLSQSHAVVVGCGALGSGISNALVRAGVGKVTLVDRDYLELNNLQRQVLYDETDLQRDLPKAVAAAEKLAQINSSIRIVPVVADFNPGNAERLIADADVVVDGTDNFSARYLINDVCVKLRKPWVYGGVVASHGMSMNILPGETPCFRCVFPEVPPPGSTPTCDTAGVLGMAVSVVASIQAMEAIKILIGAREQLNPGLIHIDVWDVRFTTMKVGVRVNDCSVCGKRQFEFLDAKQGFVLTSLCGRNAVQVSPTTASRVDLKQLGAQLARIGKVSSNDYLLRAEVDGYELTVFPDGRAIIKGTSDETVAKSLHAKYVGA